MSGKKLKVVVPAAPLAKIKATEYPPYNIIVKTARAVFSNRGTLSYSKDEQLNLVEEGIAAVLAEHATMPMSHAALAKRTKEVCRKLLRREKTEFSNGEGKRKTLDRVIHPKIMRDEETGEETFHSPIDDVGCDSTGARVGYFPGGGYRNLVEDRMIDHIHAQQVAEKLGLEDVQFILDYVDRRHRGVAISDADRQRFRRLRKGNAGRRK